MAKELISRFKYARIQGQELAMNTMYAKGVFSMCWELIQHDVMDEEDASLYKEIDDWFATHLPWPPQCNNQEKVVCFFKTENSEEMLNILPVISLKLFVDNFVICSFAKSLFKHPHDLV